MQKIFINVVLLGFLLLTFNGCSTIAGVGKDLQRAGQVVEKKAESY